MKTTPADDAPKNEAFELIKIRQRSGGSVRVDGRNRRSIGSARTDGDGPWTIYTNAKVFTTGAPGAADVPTEGYLPFVRVAWGAGVGAPQESTVLAGRRICVVASSVEVQGWIRKVDGSDPDPGVYATYSVTISQGSDGQTILPSLWTPAIKGDPSYHGDLTVGAGAVRTLTGYNAGAAENTIMFFDRSTDAGDLVPDGAHPLTAILAGPTDNFESHLGDGIPFVSGLVYVVSSSRDHLVRDMTAKFRVDAEIVTL